MVFSATHQLEMPQGFPAEAMSAFMAAARRVTIGPPKSEAWKELAGASNLTGWRFRACYEDMRSYIDSWNSIGANTSFEEMYLRDKALFGMFTSGVSCVESTCYAINALASHSTLLNLPFGKKEQRSCNPEHLRKSLVTFDKAKALVSTLDAIISSGEWRLWVDLRNRMTHRSTLPRVSNAAVGSEPPPAKALDFAATSSTAAFKGDTRHLEELFAWLSSSVHELLTGGLELAEHP